MNIKYEMCGGCKVYARYSKYYVIVIVILKPKL